MTDVEEPEDQSVAAPRRNFMVEFWTVVIGGVVSVFPFLAGLAVLFDPLRRTARADGPELVKIARLDSVPDDGVPRQFPVVKPKKDAWTYSPNERVGAVFLRREPGSDMVQAFNVVCPHAGCFVGYDAKSELYQCPCHTSSFQLDGSIIAPSPSPRGMDKLEPTKVEDGWIYVPFANYLPGKHEKIEK